MQINHDKITGIYIHVLRIAHVILMEMRGSYRGRNHAFVSRSNALYFVHLTRMSTLYRVRYLMLVRPVAAKNSE